MPKPAERILKIVEMLLEREMSTLEIEQNIYATINRHKRTIEKDIELLREHFGEKLYKQKLKKGDKHNYYYKLVNMPKSMQDVYNSSPEEIENIYEFLGLFDAKMLNLFADAEPTIVKSVKKEIKQIFALVEPPIERDVDINIWNIAKRAVKFNNKISLAYNKEKLIAYNDVKPLKIVYAHNNWYLATMISDKESLYALTFFRLKQIRSIEINRETYKTTDEIKQALRHIESMQSLFEIMGKEKYKAVIKVDRGIARYFRNKKYLKSQKITKENSDGSLIVEYHITQAEEIFPLIQRWLPQIHIIEPKKLKKRFKNLLQRYIDKESE